MLDQRLYTVSHPPYWHNGTSITAKSYHIMLAALPAVVMGIWQYGIPALRVLAFSVSWAMIWESLLNRIMKRRQHRRRERCRGGPPARNAPSGDDSWYAVIVGTFVAMLIGKHMYGGIGCNPLNPSLVALAILLLSWKAIFDFDDALRNYELGFAMTYPLTVMKYFGPKAASEFSLWGMFLGRQSGAIGATFGLGLVIGGLYLILRGFIRWEISGSFLAGVFLTAFFFNLGPGKYRLHSFTWSRIYTLISAFSGHGRLFLSCEHSSHGHLWTWGRRLTVLIRNVGSCRWGGLRNPADEHRQPAPR
jgi:electron transport complex protein RnfD